MILGTTKITEYETNLLNNILDSLEYYGANNILSSVILTGSLGRGEPTYTLGEDGDLKLKSDVEIALVFPQKMSRKKVELLIKQVKGKFKEDLNMMPVCEKRVRQTHNYNYSFVAPRYVTVFTYDLYNGSKTIWGKDFIQTHKISNESIDKFEAKRLVANRIGEMIHLRNSVGMPYTEMQWKGKVMLAIGSAWLICKNKYISSYHSQYEELKKMRKYIDSEIGTGFFSLYEKAFFFLRKNDQLKEIPDELLKLYVKGADHFFHLQGLNKSQTNNLARTAKYYIKYMKNSNKFGLIGFENKILQSLISGYYLDCDDINITAQIWKDVLY